MATMTTGDRPGWYDEETFAVYDSFLRRTQSKEYLDMAVIRKLEPYKEHGLGADAVKLAMRLGACKDTCDPNEARWNTHFQIVNGTVYAVGGIQPFWNEHHRKRVKAVYTIFAELVKLQPDLPDVEFVINFHDYNKVLRSQEDTMSWGDSTYCPPFALNESFLESARSGASRSCEAVGGSAGSFKEHEPQFHGHDWQLHYRIYGNHFGNPIIRVNETNPLKIAIFSATSCAFSYDISFPTTFYDFDLLDQEYSELSAATESLNCWPELAGRFQTTEALFPWDSKLDVAFFRGSCWFYKSHGRTAAMTMSKVAKDLVDAEWYDEIRTDMLEKDGIPQFGDIHESARYKYLLLPDLLEESIWKAMTSGRCAFLPCEEFYYGFFKPYTHYLPIKRNDDVVLNISDSLVNT
ncbi:hypothetical protein GUITHDRAFT_142809 [Guillardia theta CCMP2712]|uniref:Glycosyl transferase CAP10 domain-containing protein n=1 Tax=Guillardia theta (strain CCMP2712) TaxID=905079 RepID=L1IVQ7_GUITC|nr:hypothetical protein GUITHDRAFT_142809 [Guillardia theta CCMP2712]EKX40306.1 hypothetical protein GUITHDRAFT_142809 [Guillardia theta CCMP2712]|eukprot:XP_005827286.1 hypothetical protein GUITHDRAFT_142809 [Guillardia theta CCMP2712]